MSKLSTVKHQGVHNKDDIVKKLFNSGDPNTAENLVTVPLTSKSWGTTHVADDIWEGRNQDNPAIGSRVLGKLMSATPIDTNTRPTMGFREHVPGPQEAESRLWKTLKPLAAKVTWQNTQQLAKATWTSLRHRYEVLYTSTSDAWNWLKTVSSKSATPLFKDQLSHAGSTIPSKQPASVQEEGIDNFVQSAIPGVTTAENIKTVLKLAEVLRTLKKECASVVNHNSENIAPEHSKKLEDWLDRTITERQTVLNSIIDSANTIPFIDQLILKIQVDDFIIAVRKELMEKQNNEFIEIGEYEAYKSLLESQELVRMLETIKKDCNKIIAEANLINSNDQHILEEFVNDFINKEYSEIISDLKNQEYRPSSKVNTMSTRLSKEPIMQQFPEENLLTQTAKKSTTNQAGVRWQAAQQRASTGWDNVKRCTGTLYHGTRSAWNWLKAAPSKLTETLSKDRLNKQTVEGSSCHQSTDTMPAARASGTVHQALVSLQHRKKDFIAEDFIDKVMPKAGVEATFELASILLNLPIECNAVINANAIDQKARNLLQTAVNDLIDNTERALLSYLTADDSKLTTTLSNSLTNYASKAMPREMLAITAPESHTFLEIAQRLQAIGNEMINNATTLDQACRDILEKQVNHFVTTIKPDLSTINTLSNQMNVTAPADVKAMPISPREQMDNHQSYIKFSISAILESPMTETVTDIPYKKMLPLSVQSDSKNLDTSMPKEQINTQKIILPADTDNTPNNEHSILPKTSADKTATESKLPIFYTEQLSSLIQNINNNKNPYSSGNSIVADGMRALSSLPFTGNPFLHMVAIYC